MPNISDVIKITTHDALDYRDIKFCVCVSAQTDRYLYINTNHRDMYDDFQIKSSDYEFLNSKDRFVGCVKLHHFDSDKMLNKVGNLNRDDMLKIFNKIQKSENITQTDKDSVMPELRGWLLDIT